MKERTMQKKHLLAGLALASFGLTGPVSAQTTTVASDSGDNYTLYGQFNGLNGGTGFQPWVIVGGDGGGASFVNAQNNIHGPITTNVFDMYDNGAALPSTATRAFSTPLTVGSTFSTSFLDSYVPSNGNVGVTLDNAAGAALFTFYLPGNGANPAGGNPGDWRFVTGGIPASPLTAGQDTTIPYAYYGALTVSVTQTGAGTYSFSAVQPANVGNNGPVGGSFATTGTLPGGSRIASVVYFTTNVNGGNDVEFNNLSIVAPAPEPSQAAALGLGVLGLAGLALKARRRTPQQAS
jgi:MYXO-CTERM domain-containing protein